MATKLVPQELLFTSGTRTGVIRPVVKVEAFPPAEHRGMWTGPRMPYLH